MNNCVFFLDGVGDYSVVQKINRIKVPNNYFPFLSYLLKKYGFEVKYIDARSNIFSKEYLINIITEQKPISILINTNYDNIQHITRLNIKESYNDINVVLFSDNFDLNWLSHVGEVTIDHFIISDKSIDISDFIRRILQHLIPINNALSGNLKDISHLSVDKLVSDWTFIDDLSGYSIELNVASGCPRKCSFCSIACTEVKFRDIDLVINEIEFLLNNGIQYFHVANHSFTTDLSYVEIFCTKLIAKFNDKDFLWSCFGLPEYLYKENYIFKLLKESKLGRIELSIESGSRDILQQYDINLNKEIITEVIKNTIENDITSILGHIIIGSSKESKNSLNETFEFIQQLINISSGYIEFNISFIHPDVGSSLYNTEDPSFERFSKRNIRKLGCMHDTEELKCVELVTTKQLFNKEIYKLLRSSVCKINQKNRLTHVEYYKKGLCTQYFFHFLSRSTTGGLHQLKSRNRFFKFSWEITDEIDKYSPFILSKVLKKDEKNILVFDPLLANLDSSPFLVISSENLKMIQLADGRKTFIEIVNILSDLTDDHQNIRINLLNYYRKLESMDLLLFTKILN